MCVPQNCHFDPLTHLSCLSRYQLELSRIQFEKIRRVFVNFQKIIVWFFTVFCGDLEGAGTLPPLHSSYIQKPPKKIYFKYSFSIHGNSRSNFLGNEAELFLALFVFLVCHNTKNWLKLERRCCPRESFFHLTI